MSLRKSQVFLPDLDPFSAAMVGNLADEVKGLMERIQGLLDPGQVLLPMTSTMPMPMLNTR